MDWINFLYMLKEKWIGPILLVFLTSIAPIHSVLTVVAVLIVSDLFLGIWAAFKKKSKITSARLRDTVTKMFIYYIVIVLGFFVQQHLVDLPIVKITASVIGIVEIKSLFENASIILGRPIFDEIIKKLGSKNRE